MISDPFPTPDWALNPADYPTVFLVDSSWAEAPTFAVENRSLTTAALEAAKVFDTPLETDNHGEKTRHVIQTIAIGLTDDYIKLVSIERNNVLDNAIQQESNLPEALLSVQLVIRQGDLVVINVGTDGGHDSFALDPLVAISLNELTDVLGGVVIISAGNEKQPLPKTTTPNVVVVGGVAADGVPQSRFGPNVTCYEVVPYNLPGTNVAFGHSSAATAYMGGLVMVLLNYAKSKGHVLTGKDVVGLLKTNGQSFDVVFDQGTMPGIVPTWAALHEAINKF